MDLGRFIDPHAGPPGGKVRPWQRPGVVAYVVAAIVVFLVVAFLVSNQTEDVPTPTTPSSVPAPSP